MINARGAFLLVPLLMGCGSKWDFEDGDGDGVSAAEGDCWDKAEGPEGLDLKGSDIFPGAEETWYDGFDQNCAGDDDYDADADGYIQEEYVGLGTTGVESSGFLPPGDCWDSVEGPGDGAISGAEINPEATDVWYDGINQDCGLATASDSQDDYDQDGDGYVADAYTGLTTVPLEGWSALPGGDCVDEPAGLSGSLDGDEFTLPGDQIHSEAIEQFYDRIDQDCLGDDDFDMDGDGQRSAYHPDETDTYGLDCLDDEDGDDLTLLMEPLLLAAVLADGSSNVEVLEFLGLTADGVYACDSDHDAACKPDLDWDAPDRCQGDDCWDIYYDGFDRDCAGLTEDCDWDGDGATDDGGGPPSCLEDMDQPLCEYPSCEKVDCNDLDADISPDPTVEEIPYNGIDDNCSFADGDGDADGDDYWDENYETMVPDSEVEVPFGRGGDCDDTNDDIFPGAHDLEYNGLDEDCRDNDDYDVDGDGYVRDDHVGLTTEGVPGSGGLPGNDCDDYDDDRNPSVNEDCATSYDDDCDTDTNDLNADVCIDFYADRDADNYGKPGDLQCRCEEQGVYNELDDDDCDDGASTTHPGAAEEESSSSCRKDADEDGYGDDSPPSGVSAGSDCDDDRDAVNTSRPETCSTSYDDDCDGGTNDLDALACTVFFADVDADSYGDPDDSECRCEEQGIYNELDDDDCDDGSATTFPGAAEIESSSSCRKDDDGDGYGDSSPPSGVTAGGDCADSDDDRNPGVNERCSTSYDDDCDGDTNDRDADTCLTFYADRDGDSYGDPSDSRCYCEERGVYDESDNDDCDDDASTTHPGAAESESSSSCRKDEDEDGYGDVSPPSGVTPGTDCDDDRFAVKPSGTETCATSYDDDCDGDDNDRGATSCLTWYADRDSDGYGDPADDRCYCEASSVWNESDNDDCDDDSNTTFPGAAEAESSSSCRKDDDGDGYGDSSPPSGVTAGGDCADADDDRNPGVNERCATSYDDDCDGDINDIGATSCSNYYADLDGDGYGDPSDLQCRCDPSGVYNELDDDDCDDGASTTHPGAAEAESSSSCRKDADGDGYGDDSPPSGVTAGGDCNDSTVAVRPGATETCSTVYDDDCDADTNDLGASGCSTWYADRDSDDYGDASDSRCYCDPSGVYNESDDDDCDDSDSSIRPGAVESCDAVDSDCDGSLTDGVFPDSDGDSLPDCADDDNDGDGHDTLASGGDDCDDDDDTIYGGASESCDDIDSDCDGSLTDGLFDDSDGDGDPDCIDDDDGDGYTQEDDCDDDDPGVHPGVSSDPSTTDGIDDDCDGFIDEDGVLALSVNDVLIFSEVMVNPDSSTTTDRNNEWFEVTNVSSITLYLDNWTFEMEDNECVSGSSSCDEFEVYAGKAVTIDSGETALFCYNAVTVEAALGDSSACDYKYGSVPGGAGSEHFDAGFRLNNSTPSVLTVLMDGVELDTLDYQPVSFPDPAPSSVEGQSLMFDGGLLGSSTSALLNDDGGNWCFSENASLEYDLSSLETNYGTPGEVNPTCAAAGP